MIGRVSLIAIMAALRRGIPRARIFRPISHLRGAELDNAVAMILVENAKISGEDFKISGKVRRPDTLSFNGMTWRLCAKGTMDEHYEEGETK